MPSKPNRIHQGLIGRRGLVGSPYLAEPGLRREYDAEIAPRTQAALQRVWQRLALQPPRRVLDLGAGTGAAGQAVRAHWGEEVEVVCVDRVPGPGIIAADVTRATRPAGVAGRFDMILVAHLLNELRGLDLDRRAALVAAWCDDSLAPEGTCILLEPALRETSRALLGVRDRLLARGLVVHAPCLTQAPCPALCDQRDWCHDSAAAVVPGRSRVDFSYLALRKPAAGATDKDRSGGYRVVSDPMKDKGRLRLYVCGQDGRHLLMRLHRDRSDANRALDRVARGDLLRVGGATLDAGTLRVGVDTIVSGVG